MKTVRVQAPSPSSGQDRPMLGPRSRVEKTSATQAPTKR